MLTIAGNYFPVAQAISMKDDEKNVQVTILNDRAQGGSADLSEKGTIELMQDRVTLKSDEGPLNEPMIEQQPTLANYKLQIGRAMKRDQ